MRSATIGARDDDLVFAHPETGKPIDRSKLLKRFKAALARADVRAVRFHDLRHTFGYRLSEASGHNRAELERRLGHANDRYLRLYTNPPDEIAAGYVEDL